MVHIDVSNYNYFLISYYTRNERMLYTCSVNYLNIKT